MSASVRSRVGLAGLMALAFLSFATPAAATSCIEPLPIDQAIDEARTVFVGTVTQSEYDGLLAVFTVEEVWKGEVGATVMVTGGPSPDDLGEEPESSDGTIVAPLPYRHFEVGGTYLVLPWGVEDDVYIDDGCSATLVYDSSLDEYRPESAQPPVDDADTVLTARIALGAVALASAGAFLIARFRRRQASSDVAG